MSEKREFPILNGKLLSDLDANGHKIIGLDPEYFGELIKGLISVVLSTKVDKIPGKDLSSNDYTDEEKNKLAGIEAGAEKNPDLSEYAKANDISNSYLSATSSNGKRMISDAIQFRSVIDLILGATLNLRDSTSLICRTANNVVRSSFFNDFSWIQDKDKRTLEERLGELPTHYSLVKATPNGPILLKDKASTEVIADDSVSSISFVFPEKKQGKSRELFIRLVVTGESVPTLSFTESNGEAVSFDVDDDSWAEIEQGVNILMFTDTAE